MTTCQLSRSSNSRPTTTSLTPRQCTSSRVTTLSNPVFKVKNHQVQSLTLAICNFESRSRFTRDQLQSHFSWTMQLLRWTTKSKSWRGTRKSRVRCRQSPSQGQWVTRCELQFKHSFSSLKWSWLCSKMHHSTWNVCLNATTTAPSWWASLNCCSRLLMIFLTWDRSVMECFV